MIAILTDGVNTWFTVMDILLLVAVTRLAQVALLVNTQVTTLVLASVVLVKVAEVPFCTELPFTLKL